MMDLIVTYPSLARNKFENKNPLRLLMYAGAAEKEPGEMQEFQSTQSGD